MRWAFSSDHLGLVVATGENAQRAQYASVLWSKAGPQERPFVDGKGTLHMSVTIPMEDPDDYTIVTFAIPEREEDVA